MNTSDQKEPESAATTTPKPEPLVILNKRYTAALVHQNVGEINLLIEEVEHAVDQNRKVIIRMADEDRSLYSIDGGHDVQRLVDGVNQERAKLGLVATDK